ncbi:hypothetical protein B0A55_02087 [Friedmanniomyces simplex]|uniref:Cytochrome P450 n=1 Tax=Friedmanniomyces simplex TaxID=329884 RepID=A0A4U0XR43_9PEZI|nr:hypothetical protein B0A55_02087 [Friedmanniomyces simplex]
MDHAHQLMGAGLADRYFNPNANATTGGFHTYFESPTALLAVGLFVLLLLTRAASSQRVAPTKVNDEGVQRPPAVPSWLPLVGHIPNMAYDADGFVKGLRSRFKTGVFSLNFFGGRHNIVYSPSLATALMNQKQHVANSEEVSRRLLNVIFGFPKTELHKYDESLPEMMACYKHLLSEPSLGDMVTQTARRLQSNIVDLVTGNESLVDQTPWEKTSNVNIAMNKSGQPVVEASLLPLIRDYIAHTANPSLIGSDFFANYPDFLDDLWVLDRGFLLLATGLPRWIPHPTLTRAHIARKRMLDKLETFHRAMEKHANGEDAGTDWSSLDDVGSLVKARMAVYRKYDMSIRARAAIEQSLLWAGNANSDTLIFWMVNRIYADQALLEMIREETAPYITAVQPPSDLPIAEPPRLEKFDVDGLCNHCPLLKSSYIECLRLDTAPWSFRVIKEDFVLQGRQKDAEGWLLRKGDCAHIAHDLHSTDPEYFDDPTVWRADRHIKYEGDEKRAVADMGSIRPFGGGSSMCKGRTFAFKQSMMFAAAIVSMWDIEPAGGGPWKMPRHRKSTGVYNTNDDTRVWVKRRQLSRPQ